MTQQAFNIFLDYGPLGAFIIIFSFVIGYQHRLHQKTIERIEREKNAQLTELKLEIRELRAEFSLLSSENHVIIRDNSNTIQRNTDLIIEVGHLLRDILSKRLES